MEHFAVDFSTFNFLFNQITFTKHNCLKNSKDLGKKYEEINPFSPGDVYIRPNVIIKQNYFCYIF